MHHPVGQPRGGDGQPGGRLTVDGPVAAALSYCGGVELEFTIEPFVEGQPGPHVRAAVVAAEAVGVTVDFGPFGSSCRGPAESMPDVVAAIVAAAFGNGATHVSLHVSLGDEAPGEAPDDPGTERS